MLVVAELIAYYGWKSCFPEWLDTYSDRLKKEFLLQLGEKNDNLHIACCSLVRLQKDVLHDMQKNVNLSEPAVQNRAGEDSRKKWCRTCQKEYQAHKTRLMQSCQHGNSILQRMRWASVWEPNKKVVSLPRLWLWIDTEHFTWKRLTLLTIISPIISANSTNETNNKTNTLCW